MAPKEKKKNIRQDQGSEKSELMQKFKSNPFVFIGTFVILIIIIAAFVLVPALVPRNERAGGDLTFGYYNKVPISYVLDNYFYNYQQYLARYYQQFMTPDSELYYYQMIWQQAYQEAVIRTGIVEEMKLSGYTAPSSLVDSEVAKMPQYQENGRFSVTKYRQENNNTRMNLWRMTQENIAIDRYISDLENLKPSSREASFISAMNTPKRSFTMVSFPLDSFPETQVRFYAERNANLFRSLKLSMITVNSSERAAQTILDSITNGVITFEEAARANSQDYYADRGGEIGPLMAHELVYFIPGEFDRELVANLRMGNMSRVIQVGERSWTFFRADENPQAADLSDPAVFSNIRAYLNEYERGDVQDWALGEAEKFLVSVRDNGFISAAMINQLELQDFGPLPINFGDVDMFSSLYSFGKYDLEGGSYYDQFWKIAFGTEIMTPSAPIALQNSVVILLPLEEIQSDPGDISIQNMFQGILPERINEAIRNHIMTSPRLDDRFRETFSKNWGYSYDF